MINHKLLKVLKQLELLQQETVESDPTATVLENTLGNDILWIRENIGVYTATLEDGSFFPLDKTFILNQNVNLGIGSYENTTISFVRADGSAVVISVGDANTNLENDILLLPISIEIRIYL